MTAKLSTHALDISKGKPARGLRLRLYRRANPHLAELLVEVETNEDGRTDGPLLQGVELMAGTYEIVFEVGRYFADQPGMALKSQFLDDVPVRFIIEKNGTSYHVPLLFSPWAYSTYRGS